jgi:predicted transport protein
MVTKSKATNVKRKKAEESVFELANDVDPTGKNSDMWAYKFGKMNDTDFKKFMTEIYEDPRKYHIGVELSNSSPEVLKMDTLEKIGKKYNIDLMEYITIPNESAFGDLNFPPTTGTKVPVVCCHVRKLINQDISKKQKASQDISETGLLSGAVEGHSKAASFTAPQTSALTVSNQGMFVKEILSVRADDMNNKLKMLNEISETGEFNMKDLNITTNNMQSIQTLKVFMMGALLKVDLGDK